MRVLKKIIINTLILILIIYCILCFKYSVNAADDLTQLLDSMSSVSQGDSASSTTGILGAINTVIGLLQYAGSGIAIIVVTILGIKYVLASPSDKADVKKSIMPIIIGCVLVFGGVNIAAALYNFSSEVLKR